MKKRKFGNGKKHDSVIAQPQHPLVLFLDDLQWADEASLQLMEAIVSYPEVQNLLFIEAYRDDEISFSHPTFLTLEAMKQAPIHFSIQFGYSQYQSLSS
jgi:predicted ATPase